MIRIKGVRPAFAMALGVALLVAAKAGAAADFPPPGKMRYVVTRNGDQIGTHEMEFVRDGNRFTVMTRVDAAVTVAGITVFRFANESQEEWVDGRLASFVSDSYDNGKPHHVIVEPSNDGLWVTEHNHRKLFPSVRLVGTLWNPETAGQSLLVDPELAWNHLSLSAAYLELGRAADACPHLGRYVAAPLGRKPG